MIENMNTERDGLRYPSIDELTNKASSKYKLVIAASKRAKEIDATQKSYLEETKNFVILEEIIYEFESGEDYNKERSIQLGKKQKKNNNNDFAFGSVYEKITRICIK